tara:strand:- start:2711 stop:2902 length:192 start_codon:yes stop_codon:yes gene_type:complete
MASTLTVVSSVENSEITCKHAPHGIIELVCEDCGQDTAIETIFLLPAEIALNIADLSAQIDSP